VVPTLLSDGKLQLVSHAVDTVQANAQARARLNSRLSVLGQADDERVELVAEVLRHEVGFLPFHQFALDPCALLIQIPLD
jgi:hypothetical protein